MTTPKRNEAVAKVRSDLALAVEVLRNVGGQSAIANTVEAGAQAIDALQGEVSRLRGRTYELEAFIRHWIGDGLLQTFNNREIFRAAAATILAPNLEPPTDGP